MRDLLIFLLSAGFVHGAEPVDFQRDIRPILSNHCFKCHGPAIQKSGVRLDSLEAAKAKEAIIPKSAKSSGAIKRITSDDGDFRMPPPEAGPKLTAKQIDLLTRWIDAGAEYTPHWAFGVPTAATPPRGADHPIDAFVRAELAKNKLKPSPEADRTTLIRRVSLDLTGLLPSIAEVDTFVNDRSPQAYEKLVDRLLASPHYGERQARHWLDMARYADSNGFTVDSPRSVWPYRDWVIQAFNEDMPFDRFTREQLAGDLLSQPTTAQLVATGFHRNTAYNEEGGSDAEQFRVERTVDRANTTAAVWLGLTFACAQCHDHKYDPISQKDYYRLFAFFNSCEEPTITLGGSKELEAKIAELQKKSDELKSAGKLDEGMKVDAEIKKVRGKIPTTLALREARKPRDSFVHVRGDFLRKGDPVKPEYPVSLAASPNQPLTRLDLAAWLTSEKNPLTARVVVNRYWQQFFGWGIVETENDFGIQGSLPTHPALLDWLAVTFRQQGWSTKRLHRLIVTSQTYRQSSISRDDLKAIDPQNKLLGRQNRLRLEAEIIRDAALTASGLLSRKVGGPGVYPPLPAEVFSFTQNKKAWPESQGEDRYRRGMYTFIWRQSQHHLLTTFDAADAQVACTRRNRTNTPLQALHLANDPAFVEFFAALGKRIAAMPGHDAEKSVTMWRSCLARSPSDEEKTKMLSYLDRQPADKKWTGLARVLMNLDEFVVRE